MTIFTIQHLIPWSEFNEYEGQWVGIANNHQLTVYVQMYSGDDWALYAPGDLVNVQLWLERDGGVERLDEPVTPQLHQLQGINYEVTGQVVSIAGEQVQLDTVFPLRVDMDWPVRGMDRFPIFGVGDWLKVKGVLRLSLDDEEE